MLSLRAEDELVVEMEADVKKLEPHWDIHGVLFYVMDGLDPLEYLSLMMRDRVWTVEEVRKDHRSLTGEGDRRRECRLRAMV
ncbi:hypothetical protein Taro_006799 [Colocasia esculenta]|uniref:Uncharacterized protein n=1 Tax=Colocasia esculenta TaxID=4460 RepID=A0A843TWC3_COLES|nr:hypothetical protein [Colocasia esculenta]